MRGLISAHLFGDGLDGQLAALRLPGCVRRVAPATTQVTTAGAYKNRGRADQDTLTLDGMKYLSDLHECNRVDRESRPRENLLAANGRNRNVRTGGQTLPDHNSYASIGNPHLSLARDE